MNDGSDREIDIEVEQTMEFDGCQNDFESMGKTMR